MRGKRWGGHGHKFKARGKGSSGGKGFAGTGKMAAQKKTWVLKYDPKHLGKYGFTSRNKKLLQINLRDINNNIKTFLKDGTAKQGKETEINLKGYKVLSEGKIVNGLIIKASAFSEKAKEKIEAAGSKAEEI
jgi:large subunit ribosomal protein L15